METIIKEFHGEDQNHIILNPKEVQSFIVIMSNMLRVMNNEFPWNQKAGIEGTIKIIECFKDKLEVAQKEKVKNER